MASFFLRLEADFFILHYHARHLQQIHCNRLLFWMFDLAVIASVPLLKICEILMRFSSAFNANFWKVNKILWAVLDLPDRNKSLYLIDTLLFYLLKWMRSKLTSPKKGRLYRPGPWHIIFSVKFAWVKSSICLMLSPSIHCWF